MPLLLSYLTNNPSIKPLILLSQYIHSPTTSHHFHYNSPSSSLHHHHLPMLCNSLPLGLFASIFALTSMHQRGSKYECQKLCTLETCIPLMYRSHHHSRVRQSHGLEGENIKEEIEKMVGPCLQALKVFAIIPRTIIKLKFVESFPFSKVLIVYTSCAHRACER